MILKPAIIMICLITGCAAIAEMQDLIENGVITSPDLEELQNGSYTGDYKAGMVSAKVQVDITDHTISDFIILEHVTNKGKPAEVLADRVVEEQTLEVDTISGATVSSKVILKAAEHALNTAIDRQN